MSMINRQKIILSLIDKLRSEEYTNDIEKEFISLNLYNYLYEITKDESIESSYDLSITNEDIELILLLSSKSEKRFNVYKVKILFISLVTMIAIFIIQYYILNINLLISMIITLTLSASDLYFNNKNIFSKYQKLEEKKILKSTSHEIRKLCMKLNREYN